MCHIKLFLRCLCFDDVGDRAQRKSVDKLAPLWKMIEKYLLNSKNPFNPSDYLSVGDQLVGFRGNCPFRAHIPSKAGI